MTLPSNWPIVVISLSLKTPYGPLIHEIVESTAVLRSLAFPVDQASGHPGAGDAAAAILNGFLGSKQDAKDRWALTNAVDFAA